MNKFFALVLLSALAAVGADRTNINRNIDIFAEFMNNKLRQAGTTSAPLPEIPLDSNVKYSGGLNLGVDSLKRTADSWVEKKGNDLTFDISYGFGLLTIVLPHLEIAGTNMSAYARIRDNSYHISYIVSNFPGKQCHVKLNELRVERLGQVEFGASRPEFDRANVDGYMKLAVIPALNGIIDSYFGKIEASLQALCNVKDINNFGHAEEIVMSLF